MDFRRGALVLVLAAGPLAGVAFAGGTEVEGLAFRGRTPPGWRAGERKDDSDGSVRTFHLDVPGAGELTLTFASHTQNDADVAKTEMALSRGLDHVEGKLEVPDSEPRLVEARVPGAQEAYEVVAEGSESTWRTLAARVGKYFVGVTLTAPAGAEEQAEEAWQTATSSLRVDEPSLQVGTIVLWVLGFLVLVAVLVTLVKRRAPRTFAPPPAAYAPPAPAAPPPAREPVRYEPAPAPVPAPAPAPAPRPRGVGFSRADDGLPVFGPGARTGVASASPADATPKAAAVLLEDMRPVAPPRAPPPPAPPRPPNLHPAKPVVRIVKGYDGGAPA